MLPYIPLIDRHTRANYLLRRAHMLIESMPTAARSLEQSAASDLLLSPCDRCIAPARLIAGADLAAHWGVR